MTAPEAAAVLPSRRLGDARPGPLAVVAIAMLLAALVLGAVEGWQSLAQATINGLVSGSYFALGAAGLTLVYGVLKLVNFAHGEFLTFGAYMALLAHGTLDLPLPVAIVFGVVLTAVLAVLLELVMWRPMRRKGGLSVGSQSDRATGAARRLVDPQQRKVCAAAKTYR